MTTTSGPGSGTTIDDLAARARALAGDGTRRVLIGVAGPPGSGKSTLVAALAAALLAGPPPWPGAADWVATVPMDGFHLADAALDRLGRRDRKGAPDTFDPAGYVTLLRRLRADDDTVWAPQFERDLEQPVAGAIDVGPAARLVLTEGNYLLLDDPAWRPVAAELDAVWFCDAAEDVRVRRLVERHVEFGKTRPAALAWVRDVDGPNAVLVSATRARADLVVPGDPASGRSAPGQSA